MSDFVAWITYVAIWVLVCLCVLGGIIFIGAASGHADKTNTGGVTGRTLSRYARENEQWIQKEAIPNFLGIFFFGGLMAVFGFLALFVGQENAAAIIVNTVYYGGIALIVLTVLVCIAIPIVLVVLFFKSLSSDD